MCYIFFYVLRVRVQGHALNHNKLEMDEFIKRMTQATGGWLYKDYVYQLVAGSHWLVAC
jgi:hypothetical protein